MTRALATRMWGMRGNPRVWQGNPGPHQSIQTPASPPPSQPLQTTLGNISTARVKPSISLGTSWDLFHVGSWYGGDKVLGFYQFIDGHEWLIKLGWQKNRQEIEDNTTKRKSLFYCAKSEYLWAGFDNVDIRGPTWWDDIVKYNLFRLEVLLMYLLLRWPGKEKMIIWWRAVEQETTVRPQTVRDHICIMEYNGIWRLWNTQIYNGLHRLGKLLCIFLHFMLQKLCEAEAASIRSLGNCRNYVW